MIALLRRSRPDTYMLAMVGTVALAAVIPARGTAKDVLDHVVHAAIAVLFFIYGAKNTPRAIRAGILHWRLQASGLPMPNIIFPASTVGLIVLPLMLFHQMQLMVCAALARRYGRNRLLSFLTFATVSRTRLRQCRET